MQASAGSNLYTAQSTLGFSTGCQCCRKCGPTIPCDLAVAGDGCRGSCFCGLADDDDDSEPGFDWADPDRYSEEIETALWYDVDCDPYSRGALDVDFDDLDRSDRFHLSRAEAVQYLESPSVRWLPVLQGQTVADYLAHVALYKAAGVELRSLALVGVGSVCRRQSTGEIVELLAALAGLGLRLHGFGVKSRGLALAGEHLASADSLAWSLAARREGNDPNSLAVAEAWRTKILGQIGGRS